MANSFDAGATHGKAGIWMAGAGPVVDDSGNLFYATGNSDVDSADFSQSIVKLGPTLSPLASNRPSEYVRHDDEDFGSAGPIAPPGTNFVVMGGKRLGLCYIFDKSTLSQVGSWNCADTTVRPSNTHHLHNAMVAWQGPDYLRVYNWAENDYGRAWRLDSGGGTGPLSATTVLPGVGMPGGMMTLSANGSTSGSGILWVSMPLNDDANHKDVQSVLRAFNAEDLSQELWNSSIYAADDPKLFSKGSIPVVANGKVYLASLSHTVSVYGLRSPAELGRNPRGFMNPAGVHEVAIHTPGSVTLTELTGTPLGSATNLGGTLMANSSPWGYVRHDGGGVIVYIDRNGHIHERGSGDVDFHDSFGINAPIAAGAPADGSGPVADVIGYVRSDHQSALVYRSSDNHVIEVLSNFSSYPPWVVTDLTTSSGATVTATAGSAFPYVRSDGWNTIVYIGSDNHIHELGTPGSGASWQDGDLSSIVSNQFDPVVYPQTDPWGYQRSDGWNSVIFVGKPSGVGSTVQLHELAYYPGGAWGHWVFPTTAVPYGGLFTRPSGFVRPGNVNQVVYISGAVGSQTVHELSLLSGGWTETPIPDTTADRIGQPHGQAVPPFTSSVLFSAIDASGSVTHYESWVDIFGSSALQSF
jgi:hypothetical protein